LLEVAISIELVGLCIEVLAGTCVLVGVHHATQEQSLKFICEVEDAYEEADW